MCGIAGKIDWQGRNQTTMVERMIGRLVRRGPDSGNVTSLDTATLGHRRLSVIDLRSVADQPMMDIDRNAWIVFNGEIYNYLELRKDLERAGVVFRTDSDTEVLLAAYGRWGEACLDRLDGMFAFAIWDVSRRTLFLARDRAGEKPLYYAHIPGGFVFASQLDALVEEPAIARRVDPQALGRFLGCNYVVGDSAMISGVRRLQPAHMLSVREGLQAEPRRYWSAASSFESAKKPRRDSQAAEEVLALLDASVRARLVSDVPLGAFLSGGIDSSAIVASMTRVGKVTPETFCMSFAEDSFDESGEAARVASYLKCAHHELTAEGDAAGVVECLAAWDEPFADSSMLPTYALAKFARERVTVALSGDGGDELFAGYDTYVADCVRDALAWLPAAIDAPASGLLRAIVRPSLGRLSWEEKLARFLAVRSEDFAGAHVGWRRIFSPAEKRALLRPTWRHAAEADISDCARAAEAEVAGAHPIDRAMYIDISTWLPDDVLTKVDRATMAWGLEARAPFLDHRLIEFSASLPIELKMRGLERKRALRLSQIARLPPETLARGKAGFGSPVARWVREWRAHPEFRDSRRLAGEFFEPAAVESLWQAHLAGRADCGLKIFGLIAFRAWSLRMGLSG